MDLHAARNVTDTVLKLEKGRRVTVGWLACAAAKGYSSKVEKLKRVCKSATIAIPPSVYTRVTSEQDVSSRLKDLLSKHGLAKDFSVEEIARVKRNLKKERDLDGGRSRIPTQPLP